MSAKKMLAAALLAVSCSSPVLGSDSPAPNAGMATPSLKDAHCGTVGYITQVLMMDHNLIGEYSVGIVFTQVDGKKLQFTTYDYSDVRHSPNVRVLMTMAYTAYLAHTPVIVTVQDTCDRTMKLADGTEAIMRWSGLLLGAPLD